MKYTTKMDETSLKEDLEKCNLVFTYGTLKLGRGNDIILTRHEAQYKGSGVTVEDYVMGNVGCPYVFPVATVEEIGGVEDKWYAPVRGDLWEIPNEDCFLSLDWLEGHPSHYTRNTIIIQDDNGDTHEAWMYEQLDPERIYSCSVVEMNEEGEYEW